MTNTFNIGDVVRHLPNGKVVYVLEQIRITSPPNNSPLWSSTAVAITWGGKYFMYPTTVAEQGLELLSKHDQFKSDDERINFAKTILRLNS